MDLDQPNPDDTPNPHHSATPSAAALDDTSVDDTADSAVLEDPAVLENPAVLDDSAAMEDPAVLSESAARYASLSPDERLVAIEQLAALMSAAHAELLNVLAAADSEADWELDGTTDTAPWLVARLGLGRRNADEWVRVSRCLQSLPSLAAAYASGELSWDQVRPATRFVTPDDDTDQAAILPGFSAAKIALMARQARPVTDDEAEDAHAARSFRWRRDNRRGGWVYGGFLPFDQGEAVNQALDSIAENWGADPLSGEWSPIAVRRADALHDIVTRVLGVASVPDRATVVIHADAAVVDGEQPGNGFIGDLAVCQSGVLRALCDARVEVALHGPDGATVGVARAGQTIPWWLRRQVHHRDGTCRAPGCDRKIRQVHHIHYWSQGGPTDLDNLVGLCWFHHRMVHEGRWTIEGNPNHELTFVSPDKSRRLSSRPQPLSPKVRAQVHSATGVLRSDHPPSADSQLVAATPKQARAGPTKARPAKARQTGSRQTSAKQASTKQARLSAVGPAPPPSPQAARR